MKIEEYRSIVHEDIEVACKIGSGNAAEEFLTYATGLLINGEEFDDFIECHCEGLTRRKGFFGIDGYAIDETDGSCCIFIVDYHGPNEEDAIRSEDVSSAFKKIRFFVEESIKYELFREIQNLSAMEFSRDLYYDNDKITRYRFYLLTDAYNRQRAKTIKDETINGRTVELNVWDITRLFDLVCSQRQKESVEIQFADFGITGIPCVKAVDHVNVVADIDISPVPEKEDDDSTPENIITYSSYLAVVPGEVLNQLYLDYGSKLLEGNGEKPCYMTRHKKRAEWVQNHIEDVKIHFGLSDGKWSVVPVMFVSQDIVSNAFYHQQERIVVYSQINESNVKSV